MARVLITGSNGFIGAHLAKVLCARGDTVTCLVRSSSDRTRLNSLPVKLEYGDVTDAESLRAPTSGQDFVYHCGGRVAVLRSRDFYRVNTEGTKNVVQACADQEQPPVMLMLSSLAAARPTTADAPIQEDCTPAPVSHYGRSKRQAEVILESFADRVPITVVRPGAVFGESDPGMLPIFRAIRRSGIHFCPRKLGVSLIHRSDLVDLMLLAAERGHRLASNRDEASTVSRGYYFAACDESPNYAEFGREVAKAMGRRVLILPVPPLAVRVVGVGSGLLGQIMRRPRPLNRDKAREATAGNWLCSPQRAIEELGFSVKAPLAARIRQTVDWYDEHGWL